MAWIESHQELARHPKTKRFARLIGISLPAAVGHLHFFWWWAMDYAQDGDISKFDDLDIADACGWDGDTKTLLTALIDSGFVDRNESELHIHDWDDYVGRLLDKRKANTERKRKSRGSHAGHTQDTGESHRATVPNLTIPNQNNTTTARDEAQIQIINAYRRIKNNDLTPFQLDKLLSYIDKEGFDYEVIINAIYRAGTADSSGIRLIETIINDYASADAKTLEQAKAYDADFDARRKRGSPRQTQQNHMLDNLAKEFEQYETG